MQSAPATPAPDSREIGPGPVGCGWVGDYHRGRGTPWSWTPRSRGWPGVSPLLLPPAIIRISEWQVRWRSHGPVTSYIHVALVCGPVHEVRETNSYNMTIYTHHLAGKMKLNGIRSCNRQIAISSTAAWLEPGTSDGRPINTVIFMLYDDISPFVCQKPDL